MSFGRPMDVDMKSRLHTFVGRLMSTGKTLLDKIRGNNSSILEQINFVITEIFLFWNIFLDKRWIFSY